MTLIGDIYVSGLSIIKWKSNILTMSVCLRIEKKRNNFGRPTYSTARERAFIQIIGVQFAQN